MTNTTRPTLRDPAPWVVARWAWRIADWIARSDRRLAERAERLLGAEPRRCLICGGSTEAQRAERCRSACKESGWTIQTRDPVLRGMLRDGVPISRANYLNRAYGSTPPEDWTPELEAGLPEELRDWGVFDR